MKLIKSLTTAQKAGFIPYIKEGDTVQFMFMIPSLAQYGGTLPGIAKGGVDAGESIKSAAIREGKEELGLKQSNIKTSTIKLGWTGEITGMQETYDFSVFLGEIKNKLDFDEPHFETGKVEWLTAEEFAKRGRRNQMHIINAISRLI